MGFVGSACQPSTLLRMLICPEPSSAQNNIAATTSCAWAILGPARVASFAEEAIMRTIVLVSIALAAMSLTSTYADAGAWCATYRRGVSNCGYSSMEQCLATVRGLGGFCRPNPFPGTAYGTSSGSWNVPYAPRRYRRAY
jgi:hypothetical protein